MKIYETMRESALWEKSLMVVVYDEHGGFYDHVHPDHVAPDEWRSRAEFRHFGPRVPALFASPFIEAGAVFGSPQGEDPRFLFDHTALAKTFLTRFPGGDQQSAPERIKSSTHLGYLLTGGPARLGPPIDNAAVSSMADWWAGQIAVRLKHPASVVPALQELGVDEGPAGPAVVAQGLAALVGKLRDWIRGRLGMQPHVELQPEVEPIPATPQAVLADANELQLGIATAARHLRRDRNLPQGQP